MYSSNYSFDIFYNDFKTSVHLLTPAKAKKDEAFHRGFFENLEKQGAEFHDEVKYAYEGLYTISREEDVPFNKLVDYTLNEWVYKDRTLS